MDPIRDVAEAIVNLGIADELRLAPFIRATRERALSDYTQDGTDDVVDFLDRLALGGVLNAEQRHEVERILRGEKTPRAAPPPDKGDPYLGRSFGSFKALAKIGEGGMGAVYRAEREDDGSQDYVIKVLSPLAADAATYIRFRREGEVMQALRNPNVVRVFKAGEQDGLSYIVMEFVDGPTLQDLFEKRQKFDWQNAAKAVRQIALALDAAHAIGVIHRDVKPQNVLLSRTEGLLKVADFGLAKRPRQHWDPHVTRAGDILGSPAYIAPEQWGDHDVDPRADLFALGVILYQLVTGVLPFRGRTPSEYARRILGAPHDPIELYAPDCPEGLKQIVARLLEKKREWRYSTAGQVTADLERVLRKELPDVPRLARPQGAQAGERWVLLGREQFLVGRAAQAYVQLQHATIAERHALIERTGAGLVLRELEGKGLVRVNGMRVREITLKDNDVLEFGDAAPVRYRAGAAVPSLGGVATTPSPGSGTNLATAAAGAQLVPPVSVPGPLYEALLRDEHPRAVLALIELLDETTWVRKTERARRRLEASGIDAGTANEAVENGLATYRRIAAGIPDRLFRATHENLGPDPETWLGWWFTSGRARFPQQAMPPGPRAYGVIVVLAEGSESFTSTLSGIEQWTAGRGSDCHVHIEDRSVSRRHATFHRLLTRFAIRDEGSRFGTVVRGERHPVLLLRHDDTIELGRAKVIFRQPDEREGTQEEAVRGLDAAVFDALVEMRSPSVIGALVGLLDSGAIEKSLERDMLAADEETSRGVRSLLEERRQRALEGLRAIARTDEGADPTRWRAWWHTWTKAGPQVSLEGWSLTA